MEKHKPGGRRKILGKQAGLFGYGSRGLVMNTLPPCNYLPSLILRLFFVLRPWHTPLRIWPAMAAGPKPTTATPIVPGPPGNHTLRTTLPGRTPRRCSGETPHGWLARPLSPVIRTLMAAQGRSISAPAQQGPRNVGHWACDGRPPAKVLGPPPVRALLPSSSSRLRAAAQRAARRSSMGATGLFQSSGGEFTELYSSNCLSMGDGKKQTKQNKKNLGARELRKRTTPRPTFIGQTRGERVGDFRGQKETASRPPRANKRLPPRASMRPAPHLRPRFGSISLGRPTLVCYEQKMGTGKGTLESGQLNNTALLVRRRFGTRRAGRSRPRLCNSPPMRSCGCRRRHPGPKI